MPPKTPPHTSTSSPLPTERLIPLREVKSQVGMCRTTIYTRIAAGEFPKHVKLGKSSRWLQSEIQNFIEQQANRRGQAKAA